MKPTTVFASFLASVSQGAGFNYAQLGADWGDSAPMCARNDNSPIDIRTNTAIYDDTICDGTLNWNVDWSVHDWSITNNGHSIGVTPLARTDLYPDITVEGIVNDDQGRNYTTRTIESNVIARLANNFLPEGSPNDEFCLHSFHFHWGPDGMVGSEHTVDGFAYPLEVHFVHYSCNRANIGEALGPYGTGEAIDAVKADGGDPYELAVVGIFIEETEYDNPAFEAILSEDTLERIQVKGEDELVVTNSLFLNNLVPEELFTAGYYSYQGGLTTPPCTPIVRWHVSNAKSYIGKAQMARFREMMESNDTNMAPNYRETVYNEHPLYACMAEPVDDDDNEVVFTKQILVNKTEVVRRTETIDKTKQESVWVWAIVILVSVMIMSAAFVYWAKLKYGEKDAHGRNDRLFSSEANAKRESGDMIQRQ